MYFLGLCAEDAGLLFGSHYEITATSASDEQVEFLIDFKGTAAILFFSPAELVRVFAAFAFQGVVSGVVQIEVAFALEFTGKHYGVFGFGRTVLVLSSFCGSLDIF